MDKINFENLPSTNTSISAENLNQLQVNVENAINEVQENLTKEIEDTTTDINNKLAWKKIGTISKVGEALSIPADATEIYIDVYPKLLDDGVSVYIIKDSLEGVTHKRFDEGYYKSDSDMLRVLVQATTKTIHIQEIVFNGTTYDSIYQCNVYYR